MLVNEIISEGELPDCASFQRKFDLSSVDNRRFIFNPKTGKFIIGDIVGAGKNRNKIVGSHSQDYFNVTGSNNGFDQCVRGWISGNKNGVIHFAPQIFEENFGDGWKCLEALIRCGANENTLVRGFPKVWEQPLGNIIAKVGFHTFNEDVDTNLTDSLDLTSFETFMNSLKRVPKEQVESLNALLMRKREEADRPLAGLTELYHGAPDHHAHDIKTNGFKLTTGERGSFMGGVREVQNQGIFLTDSKAMAGYFGSNRSKYGNDYKTLPCYVDTSHVLDYERAPRAIVKLGLKLLNEYHGSTLTKIPKGEWWWLLDEPEFVDALKASGFTGVKFQEHIAIRREINQSFNGDATTAHTYLIFDPNMVKQRKGISVEDFYEMLHSGSI